MLFAVAVKVTDVPVQIGPAGFAVIFRLGMEFGFTTIEMILEDVVVAVKQVPPVIVISQVTVLPLASVEVVNVLEALFCTLLPLTLKL